MAHPPRPILPAGFSRRRSSGVHANEDSNMYEDSFSEIPDAVLEAATPRAPRTTLFPASADGQSEKLYGSHQKAASVASNAPDTVRSDTSRLLTPDETPRPMTSPPGPELFTSTSPLIDANFSKPTVTTERERRTAMSPIVRAGLALQSVTSDHSSPAGRRSVLGSPFKGSAKSSRDSSVAPASEHKSAAKPSPQLPAHMDDPFGPSRSHNGQSSFMKALNNSSRRSSLNQRGPARPSLFDTTRAVVDDADEMSWIAEPTIEAPLPMLAAASRSSSVAGTVGSVDGVEEQAAIEPSVDGSAAGQEGDETEDDIWMMEDEQRSAVPQPTRQDSLGSQEITGTRGLRRTELPNTWRQSAFGRSIATRPPTRQMGGQEGHSLVEDYSLLSQRSKKAEAASSAVDEGQKRAALNLSDFFSSPAVLPPRPGFEDARVRQIIPNQGAGASKPSNNGSMTTQLTNSLFPSVPQKEFQPSPVRKRSLFTSSVQSSRPSEPSDTEIQATSSPSVRSELAQPSSVPQKANFTPRRRDAKRTLEAAAPTQSSVGSTVGLFSRRREPEEPAPTSTVSAKSSDAQLNIAPPSFNLFSKPAQAMAKLQGSAPRTATAPPRSPERYPLHKTMSPTKSCLRSPLKPKTPGRVVEWASSVLSPLQQAEIRTQNQNQQPVLKQPVLKQPQVQQHSIVPTVQLQPPSLASSHTPLMMTRRTATRYDRVSRFFFPERKQSSPSKMEVVANNPFPTHLSQATWSRDHWVYLDGLLQYRREQPFPKDVILPEVRGMCRELLGKRLRSREAFMPLQQWHLDVIEAFHSQVGGWSKNDLSTRIFSLLLGEKLAAEGRREEGGVMMPA
ncbi:unnamed protein product [Parascedosporium putredinis]|uniref:Uncharacterized protein n=1 Tax=Parascedosporium putredinis TaxID=1442378 RepID=A0A9P1ME07_9PEZI|nr:unnamed protein product [Parascedosporium putredinis]CAI7999564.1 unnamed protein product [Parascedosporium putredinis]